MSGAVDPAAHCKRRIQQGAARARQRDDDAEKRGLPRIYTAPAENRAQRRGKGRRSGLRAQLSDYERRRSE